MPLCVPTQRACVLVLGLVVLSTLVAARAGGQRLHLRSFGVDDGLPSAQIRDIGQDASGRLWVATRAGIATYDGRTWLTHGLGEGLDWADQHALLGTSSGWWSVASMAPFPLYRFDGARWRRTSDATGMPPRATLRDVASWPADAAGVEPSLVAATAREGLLRRERDAWRRLDESTPPEPLYDLEIWRDQLLVAGRDGVAALRDDRLEPQFRLVPTAAPNRRVRALASSADEADPSLWLIGDGWLGRHRDDSSEVLAVDPRIGDVAAGHAAVDDGLGGVYFSCGGGLCSFHPGVGLESFDEEDGLDTQRVDALFLDREATLWIGGPRGLRQLVSRQFRTWHRRFGLFDDAITAALERRDGTLVLGHRGGLSQLAPTPPGELMVTTTALPLGGARGRLEPVRDLLEDHAGAVWAPLDSAGLVRLDAAGGARRFAAEHGLQAPATAVAETPDGRLWVGSERGLWLFDARRERFRPVTGGPPQLKIRRLFVIDDALWIASADGLHRLDQPPSGDASARTGDEPLEVEWSSWRCDGGPCNSVFSLLERPFGGLWVGTAAGLYRLTAGGLIAESEPRLERPVFFALREPAPPGDTPRYWFGTDDGVDVWTPGSGLRNLSVEEGLAGREVQRAAGLVDRDGRVWIGTDRGVSVHDRRFEAHSVAAPVVELVAVVGDGLERAPDQPQRLTADGSELAFRVRVVSLRDPLRVRTQARLDPFDAQWNPVEPPEIRYSSVPAGTFQLRLRAAVPGGSWSDSVASAPIVVVRPFFRQPWFFVLLGLVAVAAILLLQNLTSRLQHSRTLEREVERRVAELRASEDRYRKTFKSIDDGVVTTDADGRVELLNPRAEAISGWSARKAAGLPLDDVLHLYRQGADEDETVSILHPNPRDSIGPTLHATLRTREGKRKAVELTASPIFGEQRMIGLVVVVRDVSRRREIEEELARAQKLEAVGILAGGIAHDFNNLLTVLMGNLSLVRDAPALDDEDRRSLDDAETALVRARDLTQQLLTFSRGGAPVREASSIAEVIRDSTSFVLRGSKVRCDLDLADNLWVVEIDAGQISQVLNNLLINAVQAMSDGGVVRVVGRNIDASGPADSVPQPLTPGRFVAIDVIDRGVGISDEVLGRIFDPYFSTKQEGRGLGLTSAYSIVKRHDGLLTVRSRPGEGTTFRIYLPASAKELPTVGPAPSRDEVARRGGGRVLLMDDDPDVRRTAAAMLRRLGSAVVEASDGQEAIDLYAQALRRGERFDLVLTDLTVPGGMGGQDAVRELRDLDEEVVAVVYSGYSTDPVLAHYADYGFAGRLTKPFRLTDLAHVLGQALEAAARRRAASAGG